MCTKFPELSDCSKSVYVHLKERMELSKDLLFNRKPGSEEHEGKFWCRSSKICFQYEVNIYICIKIIEM